MLAFRQFWATSAFATAAALLASITPATPASEANGDRADRAQPKLEIVSLYAAGVKAREVIRRPEFGQRSDGSYVEWAHQEVYPAGVRASYTSGAPECATIGELFQVRKRTLTLSDTAPIAKESGLRVIMNGIQLPDHAVEAVKHGAAAIRVSKRGESQIQTDPAAITSLPAVVDAVGDQVQIYIHGRMRLGTPVFQALALAASAVGVGRPVHHEFAFGSAASVSSSLTAASVDLELAVAPKGKPPIAEVTRKPVT